MNKYSFLIVSYCILSFSVISQNSCEVDTSENSVTCFFRIESIEKYKAFYLIYVSRNDSLCQISNPEKLRFAGPIVSTKDCLRGEKIKKNNCYKLTLYRYLPKDYISNYSYSIDLLLNQQILSFSTEPFYANIFVSPDLEGIYYTPHNIDKSQKMIYKDNARDLFIQFFTAISNRNNDLFKDVVDTCKIQSFFISQDTRYDVKPISGLLFHVIYPFNLMHNSHVNIDFEEFLEEEMQIDVLFIKDGVALLRVFWKTPQNDNGYWTMFEVEKQKAGYKIISLFEVPLVDP